MSNKENPIFDWQEWVILLAISLALGFTSYMAFSVYQGKATGTVLDQFYSKTIPPFEAKSIQPPNEFLSPDALKGRISMVNFFASWCTPCKAEHPYLIELQKEYDLIIHGIYYQDTPDNIDAYLVQNQNPYATVSEGGQDSIRAFGVAGLPESFIIDPAGNIRLHHRGPIMKQDLEKIIVPMLETLRD